MPVCGLQSLAELCEFVVDGNVLETSPICCETLIEWHCVTLGVLPVADWWRDLPHFLVFGGQLAWRRVEDRRRGRGWTAGNALVLELRWLHRVELSLLNLENTGLALGLAHLRGRCVSHESRLVILAALDVLRFLRSRLP